MNGLIIKGYFLIVNGSIKHYTTSLTSLVSYMEMIRFSDYSELEMKGYAGLNLVQKIDWMVLRQFQDDSLLLNPTAYQFNYALDSTKGAY